MDLFMRMFYAVTDNWHYFVLVGGLVLLGATGIGLEYSVYLEEEGKED